MSGQEEDSNLSSKIDVFCNKYRFLMVEVLTEKGSIVLKLWRVEVDRKAFSAD